MRQYFSPAAYGTEKTVVPAITQYCHGRLIDLGCGDMPYRDILREYVSHYDSLDVSPCSPEITFQGDIQNMGFISDSVYDTALCLEVLEHVPDPCKALCEIHRILTQDGVLIVSAPHLSRLHEEPHDYFRFTHHGLRALLERAGFAVVEIRERGGLFCFLGHQVSTLFLTCWWDVPLVHRLAFFLNKWCSVRLCWWLDHLMGQRLFPLGYTCVAKKIPR